MPRSTRANRGPEQRPRKHLHGSVPPGAPRRAKPRVSADRQYREAVLASPDAVLIHSEGRIVLVNDAMVSLFRAHDAAELLGRPAMFMLPEAMAQEVAERIRTLYAGRPLPRTEQRYRLLDGSWIDVEVAALPVRFEGRPAAHVNVRDISERKRAEDNLRRFRLAMDSSPDMILLIDRASMRYVDVNPAVTRLLGYTREEMLALGPQDVLPASRESLERSYDELIADPAQTGSMNSYYVCKDGSKLPFESTRHVIRSGESWIIAAISRDIRDRLERETALRESEARYRSLVDLSPDAVFTQRDGRIRFMNQAGARLYGGRTPSDFEGRRILDLVHPSGRTVVAHRLEKVQGAAEALSIKEIPQQRLDGSLFFGEVHTTPIDVEGGRGSLSVVRDVTQRREMEEALRASEEQYRMLFEKNPNPMWVYRHADLRILAVNEQAIRHYGYSREEFLAMTLQDVRPAEDLAGLPAEHAHPVAEVRDYGQWRHRRKDGSLIDVHVLTYGVTFREEPAHIALITDITERLLHERQIEYLATHDGLTGLPNRNLLGDRAAQGLAGARRQRRVAALLLLDLDNFKLHNDTFGHVGGDTLLKKVAVRLAGLLREGDTLARLGGDEFVALLGDLARIEDVAAVVAKLRAAFAEPFSLDGREIFLTASVGISAFPADGEDLGTLLRHADAAMYKAKELGRDGVQFFTPELNRRAAERLAIEADMRRALARGEFLLFYQPQVDLYTRRIVGAEALVRWRHPRRGMLAPGQFIGIAEESGLIVSLGNWILEEGCRQLRAWQDAGLPALRIAFNVSARQFRDGSLPSRLAAVLQGAGVAPDQVELEVTENIVMGSAENFVSSLRALKQVGVMLSIDDFGTGYSNLSYLSRFPIDRLKIDQSFVRGIGADENSASISRTVIALGRSLGLGVVAEGVETFEQLEFVRVNGCHEVQGYYFGKPMPAEAFAPLAREGLPPGLWSGA